LFQGKAQDLVRDDKKTRADRHVLNLGLIKIRLVSALVCSFVLSVDADFIPIHRIELSDTFSIKNRGAKCGAQKVRFSISWGLLNLTKELD
jgi:hypothetical protein